MNYTLIIFFFWNVIRTMGVDKVYTENEKKNTFFLFFNFLEFAALKTGKRST